MPTIIPIRNNIISNNIVYNSQWIALLSCAPCDKGPSHLLNFAQGGDNLFHFVNPCQTK